MTHCNVSFGVESRRVGLCQSPTDTWLWLLMAVRR